MVCDNCIKIIEKDYKARKVICGRCREILKVDLVDLLQERMPVYLTEMNRNKKGRPCKLSYSQKSSVKYKYKYKSIGATTLAKNYNVSRATIYNIINDPSIG